jgi:hypothetical protein
VWAPFQTHHFSENLVAPRIEPGISGSVVKNSDHKTTEAVVNTEVELTLKIGKVTDRRVTVILSAALQLRF